YLPIFGRCIQELTAYPEIIQVVQPLLRSHVVEHPVALRAAERQACGEVIGQRPTHGGLCLDVSVIPIAQLGPAFGHERGLTGSDIERPRHGILDRKSTRLNSSHVKISYAVFCLNKKKDRL